MMVDMKAHFFMPGSFSILHLFYVQEQNVAYREKQHLQLCSSMQQLKNTLCAALTLHLNIFRIMVSIPFQYYNIWICINILNKIHRLMKIKLWRRDWSAQDRNHLKKASDSLDWWNHDYSCSWTKGSKSYGEAMLTGFSLYLEKNQIRRKRLFHLKKGSDTVEATCAILIGMCIFTHLCAQEAFWKICEAELV